MSTELEEKRSRWPIVIVLASVLVLIVTFAVGVHFSSTSETSNSAEPTSADSLDVLIDIFDYEYHPAIVSVPRGAEVTWVNDDKVQHTATERDGLWDTTVLSEGEAILIKFSRPGTYEYYCTIHPYMAGTLTVR